MGSKEDMETWNDMSWIQPAGIKHQATALMKMRF